MIENSKEDRYKGKDPQRVPEFVEVDLSMRWIPIAFQLALINAEQEQIKC